jgi:DNA-binding FadR family transcriptional regulator
MRASAGDEAAFNAADVRFHATIAAASGNRMLSFLVEGMEESLHSSRMHSIRGYRSQARELGPLIDLHQEVFDRIADRNADAAAASMRKHLIGTRNDLRAAFAMQNQRP